MARFYDFAMSHDAMINTTSKLTGGYAACLHCGCRGMPSRTTEDKAVLVPCPVCTQPRCEECAEHYTNACPLR